MGLMLEVCVDTAEGLAVAVAGGADRIELCAALSLGGLTPPAGLMALAAKAPVPVMAMIRPRAGDFHWSEAEVEMMEAEIAGARTAGLAGVVLGASRPDGRLEADVLKRLVAAANGMDLTLHRVFDLVPDMNEALEVAISLGFTRVLTSGGAVSVAEGLQRIAGLALLAGDRIGIMPGAGVNPSLVPVLKSLGISELHASCSSPMPGHDRLAALGLAPAGLRQTDAALLQALRQAMDGREGPEDGDQLHL